jgi:hypothetical protein
VGEHGGGQGRRDRAHGEDVVEVGVGEQDPGHMQVGDGVEDAFGFVTGIDQQRFGIAARVHRPAVGFERADDDPAQHHLRDPVAGGHGEDRPGEDWPGEGWAARRSRSSYTLGSSASTIG